MNNPDGSPYKLNIHKNLKFVPLNENKILKKDDFILHNLNYDNKKKDEINFTSKCIINFNSKSEIKLLKLNKNNVYIKYYTKIKTVCTKFENGKYFYDQKKDIDGIIMDFNFVKLNFWSLEKLEKFSIVFPKLKSEDNYDMSYRNWWKILSIKKDNEGFVYDCVLSSNNFSFS